MRSFRVEFDEYFEDGIISEIEVGLGACGELRYPSYAAKHGWKYPGIGEFQVQLHLHSLSFRVQYLLIDMLALPTHVMSSMSHQVSYNTRGFIEDVCFAPVL